MAVTLTGERLVLEPMGTGDIAFFHRINNDAFVGRYLWDDEAVPRGVSEDILQGVAAAFAEAGWGLWRIMAHADGRAVGYAGLWTFFDEPQPQLLYALQEEHTGLGYATDAASLVLDHTFNTLGFEYVDASMDVEHEHSALVCERLGFRMHDEREADGKLTRFYRMHASDWKSQQGFCV